MIDHDIPDMPRAMEQRINGQACLQMIDLQKRPGGISFFSTNNHVVQIQTQSTEAHMEVTYLKAGTRRFLHAGLYLAQDAPSKISAVLQKKDAGDEYNQAENRQRR